MLELDRLSRTYGSTVALDELSFTVAPGEVVGFLGPNGAGKTTAMRAVLGIVHPDSGDLRWQGKPLDLETRLRFGYMPEERGLYPTMKILEQLTFLGKLHGMRASDASTSALHWLGVLGVGDRGNMRVDSLSMGNQQRVQLAAALVHSPELLVLDEPFSGLDPTGIEALSAVLKQRAAEGTAVVFSSHQLDLVENLCERVVIVNKGRRVTEGFVEELTVSNDVLSVSVEGDPEGNWAAGLSGVEQQGVERGAVRLRLLDGTSSRNVLDAAQHGGTVRHFSYERKRLSEVFREAVAT